MVDNRNFVTDFGSKDALTFIQGADKNIALLGEDEDETCGRDHLNIDWVIILVPGVDHFVKVRGSKRSSSQVDYGDYYLCW